MKRRIIAFATLGMTAIIFSNSCSKSKSNTTNISAHNGNESHNMGQNCMNCHKQGGQGEGWFNVAGTVYNSGKTSTFANATVKLYTGPNGTGTLKYTVNGDAKGNFYTTESIDFGSGLYPVVEGSSGQVNYMPDMVTSGQCNSCHGISTGKIWTQ